MLTSPTLIGNMLWYKGLCFPPRRNKISTNWFGLQITFFFFFFLVKSENGFSLLVSGLIRLGCNFRLQ